MIKLSLKTLAEILQVKKQQRCADFHGVSIDSRTIKQNNLFVALRGKNFNGHDFISEAQDRGAAAALVQNSINCPNLPHLIVSDTRKALGQLAAFWRGQFNVPLIAVTGSNGKTTVKNMIASIFKKACGDNSNLYLATAGNLNNEIGLPLSLTKLSPEHRYSVFEMGMNHFGEIAYLTKLASPNVAVITNAGASHLEFTRDLSGVARAKGEIFQGLRKDGTAVLNADDAYYNYWKRLITTQKIVTFSLQAESNVTAKELILETEYSRFILNVFDDEIGIKLPLSGHHNVMNALVSAAACFAAGISLHRIKEGLESVQIEGGRFQKKITKTGINVFDDTYNANPLSLSAAVDALMVYSGKKIIVLGDMKELGEQEKTLHFDAGRNMKQKGINYLLTFGELSAEAAKGFGEQAFHFISKEKLLKKLKVLSTEFDSELNVLIKGSRSMHMEEIAEQFIDSLNNVGA